MSSSNFITLLCVATALALSKHGNTCLGFTMSPLSNSGIASSSSTLHLFGRKSRQSKQQVVEPKPTEKKELKIVELDQVGETVKMKVSVQELRKIFDNVDELLQGETSIPAIVARPKVVSSSSLITQADVLAAHKAWGDGLCLIAKTHE